MPRADVLRCIRRATMLALVCCPSVYAQTPAVETDSLMKSVDQWVTRGLERFQIAGAALAVVHDGRVVHTRGFGLSDIRNGIRVDPDSTTFHIASVTKLITAIAALQQVEAGRLALHQDARPLLGDIGAKGWATDSFTVHHLLTHTAGFDTRWIGMATTSPQQVEPLVRYASRSMPPLVSRPGEVIQYSNMGYVAVGRLIEIASGQTWAQFVEQHVLAPLAMEHSYAQPRPPTLAHAVPYRYRTDTLEEPSIFEHAAPSGAVHATAVDVARLLIALLDSGSSMPVSPTGKLKILTPQFANGKGSHGYGYGTFEFPNEHVRAVSAGGEVPGFSTRLLLVPSLRFGIVLMVNRKDPLLAVSVFDSVLAQIAPGRRITDACGTRNSSQPLRPVDISGTYRSNAYDRGSFLKVGALLGSVFKVSAADQNSVTVIDPLNNKVARWKAVDDSVWSGPDGACLNLLSTRSGPMLVVSTGLAGPVMLERITARSNPAVVVSAALASTVMLTVLSILELLRKRRGSASDRVSKAGRSGWMTTAICFLHWLFLLLFAIGLNRLAIQYDDRFAFGIPWWYSMVLLLPYAALVLTAFAGYQLLRRGSLRYGVQQIAAFASSSLLLLIYYDWHMVWLA